MGFFGGRKCQNAAYCGVIRGEPKCLEEYEISDDGVAEVIGIENYPKFDRILRVHKMVDLLILRKFENRI